MKETAMVNLVIVSHSAQLGQGVGELARQMLTGDGCKLAIAAGLTILIIRSAPIRLK
jgi:dihydroxyacetone kinase DhaKLM complex PTS-EIIA-like component DhaM